MCVWSLIQGIGPQSLPSAVAESREHLVSLATFISFSLPLLGWGFYWVPVAAFLSFCESKWNYCHTVTYPQTPLWSWERAVKSRILFFLLLLYLAQNEAFQACDGIMLKPRSLLHPLLESFFQGRISDVSRALQYGRTRTKSCGWQKEGLLNDHKEEELIAHRSGSQAVSQGWTGRTGKRHGGRECPAPQLWTHS